MKKILAMILVLALALSFTGCGEKMLDGTYTARADDAHAAAAWGWTDTLTVTYRDGKLVEVDFDSFAADGSRKSEASAEVYPMPYAPAEWFPLIEKAISVTANPDKVATVAGATLSSDSARTLYRALREAAAAGNTETVVVEMSAAE